MKKLETIEAMRTWSIAARAQKRRIGFVPTMGALHEGHYSLVRAARSECDLVVVSIFVNPTQFGPGEDFQRYPRPVETDLAGCERAGVDLLFAPGVDEMYPSRSLTRVVVSRLADGLCGPHRPGHFEGVATVVAKLFNIVQPHVAYFGQKDYQQSVIVRQMVRDLNLPLQINVCPTVREPDGLAMSSRNEYLSRSERAQARSLSQALSRACERVSAGERDVQRLIRDIRESIASAGPCLIDYVECVDAQDLSPRSRVEGRCVLAVAVRIGSTRLIDNVLVDAPAGKE